jgi:hypothetical protein
VNYLTLGLAPLRDIAPASGLVSDLARPSTPTETTMFTKTLFAALILATASAALASKANAGPIGQQNQGEYSWMDRASKVTDGGN